MKVRSPHYAAKAKSVIFLFMDGGPSHVDTFDYKPRLEQDRGKPLPVPMPPSAPNSPSQLMPSLWPFKQHGQSGTWVSDLFPHVAQCVDDMAIIRSMVSDHSEHTAGNYFMHSGSSLQGRPSMGSWVTYGLGSPCRDLPGFVVIDTGMIPPGGMDLFGSGFLPASYQGMMFRKGPQPVADLAPRDPAAVQKSKLELLEKLDRQALQEYGAVSAMEAAIVNYELAFRMQSAVPELFDFSKESEVTRKMYGIDQPDTDEFGRACLATRRMVEKGVRFIELLSPRRQGVDRWDQHGRIVDGHGANCKATDQPVAALLRDLKSRGLLDQTLVVWGGEFGRTPQAQGGGQRAPGRDHHPYGFTMWMAGGGVKGGRIVGQTDDFGLYGVGERYHMRDFHATILHLLGLDQHKLWYLHNGRHEKLTDFGGKVIEPVFA
jgi:hypothetical protein